MLKWIWDNMKVISSAIAGCVAVCTGYVSIGGPIPASRQWVIAQNSELKSRLIDNSLQTNHLQLDLLRKEQTDRTVQIQTETNQHVKEIYQERLNTVGDSITETTHKNSALEKEKQEILSGGR